MGTCFEAVRTLQISETSTWVFLLNNNFYNSCSVMIFFVGVLKAPVLRNILSLPPFVKLGEISYYVFLVHWPLTCTFSASVFMILMNKQMEPVLSARILFVVTLLVTLVIGWILTKYIDGIANKITNRLVEKV